MAEGSNRAAPRNEQGSGLLGALIRNLMSLFFVGVAVMCVYNVFGVGGEVEAMAKETACQGQPLPCTAQYTRAERTPFAHTFMMYTSAKSGEKEIVCKREYVLVGDYSCQFKGAAASAGVVPSGAPSSSSSGASVGSAPVRFPKKIVKTPLKQGASGDMGTMEVPQ